MTAPFPERPPAPAANIVLALFMGVIAVVSCGVPFVPPLAVIAVPLAGVSVVLLARMVFRGMRWTLWRAVSALIALAIDGFALYLALGRHHLIDWLEGH